MNEIFLSILFFIFSVSLHIVTFRLLRQKISAHLLGTIIYFINLCILCYVFIYSTPSFVRNNIPLPLSSIVLYVTLVTIVTVFTFYQSLEGQTPIDTLFDHFSQKKSLSKNFINSLFTNEKIILPRLINLESAGVIKKKNNTYSLTNKGTIMWNIIKYTCLLFGLTING